VQFIQTSLAELEFCSLINNKSASASTEFFYKNTDLLHAENIDL